MTTAATRHTICPLCEATCGLEVQLRASEVLRIAGNKRDGFSRGFICPKGAALAQLHSDPDRLRQPLIREEGAQFREVSWAEAFSFIESRLLPSLGGDPQAAAVYLGNPNVHSPAGMLLPRGIVRALGTRNLFTSSTVDQMPKHIASGLMYGDPHAICVPDIDRTDYFLLLGANPWESNGSLCTAPDFPGRIADLHARGGKFVVVDPRRTRTAAHADEHIPISPGTDTYLLLAMAHVIARDGRMRLGRLVNDVADVDLLVEAVRPYAPKAVSDITGVPASVIERLAYELSERERAVVYGRLGTHTARFGTLAAWAVDVLNVITGHVDEPGGVMWPRPAHAPRYSAGRRRDPAKAFTVGRWRSRVKGYPEVLGEFPSATLADEIETEGPGQVRVLITIAGNPVLSTPHSARLDRALSGLSLMISVDPYLNETTRHAHVILPPPSSFTRSHYDFALSGFAVRNYARWTPALLPSNGPSEAEILARLTLLARGLGADSDPALVFDALEQQAISSAIKGNDALSQKTPAEIAGALEAREPLDRVVEIMLRAGSYGDAFGAFPDRLTFAQLRDNPHGVDLGPLAPALSEKIRTNSGRIELMPELIRLDLARLADQLTNRSPTPAFVLIGRRDLRSNNSWLHNLPILMKGRPRCTLQLHPSDAERLSIQRGQHVRISTSVGELVVPAEVTDSVQSGVVCLPHGFGHDLPGTRTHVASANAGVNFNLLTDESCVDPLSGNAVLNGLPVDLAPV